MILRKKKQRSKRGQLQSKKERQRILCGLKDHRSYGNAASAAKPLLASIDQLACQIKQLEQVSAIPSEQPNSGRWF
jgi:hypothetical protein